jgi:hypothetical protein
MPSFTPGPWVTQPIDGAFEIRDGRGWVLAQRGPWPINAEESAANARLIAAAPELARELRGARCPRPCNPRPDDFEVGQCLDAGECGCSLGVALAKAGA